MAEEDIFQCRVSPKDSMAVEINKYYQAARVALVMHHEVDDAELNVISVHLDREDALRLMQSIYNLLPHLGACDAEV